MICVVYKIRAFHLFSQKLVQLNVLVKKYTPKCVLIQETSCQNKTDSLCYAKRHYADVNCFLYKLNPFLFIVYMFDRISHH